MPLTSGTRIGTYEILEPVGAGGMGEVYRARDTKLKRDVALKILPEAFARDSERMARFQREAEVLASLNHPRIAAIYGIESGALVMEFIDGETLDRALPLNTALDYARQIAEGLEYAHDRGIIHRDLKPANIKVTRDGEVKLLDFGLAKAADDPSISRDPSTSPTLTPGATQAGMILGTAAYMSPEQAQGKTADRRSDIFSFGAVFYEMLTGRRAFAGESVPDTLASVLKLEPDWSALPAETPAAVRALLRRCLTKDRKQRLQAIGEARFTLENPTESAAAVTSATRPWRWIASTALLAFIASVALWGWLWQKPPELQPSFHFATTLTPPLLSLPFRRAPIALAPDGSLVAYTTVAGIYLRPINEAGSRLLPGTENAVYLGFSADGQSIAFATSMAGVGQIRRVSLGGGPVRDLSPLQSGIVTSPLHWGLDGNIYFAESGGLVRIPENGGQPQTLVARTEGGYAPLQVLPGGKNLLAIKLDLPQNSGSLEAIDLVTGTRTVLVPMAASGHFTATGGDSRRGHLIYTSGGSVVAVAFDAEELRLMGDPVPLPAVSGTMAVSERGTLAYVPGADLSGSGRQLVWLNRQGAVEAVPIASRPLSAPIRLSPDGQRLVAAITGDLWLIDILRGTFTKITSDGNNSNPMWTPDGKVIIYVHVTQPGSDIRRSIRAVPADRSAPPTVLTKEDGLYVPNDVSHDGKTIFVRHENPEGGGTYFAYPFDSNTMKLGEGKPFLESRSQMNNLTISANGRFVAYQSSETGRVQINVTAYPGPGPTTTISTDGGLSPMWSANGRELLWMGASNKVMVVDVKDTPDFQASAPRALFESPYRPPWDLAPDGRLIMTRPPVEGQARPDELHIITNWFDELRRLAPPSK